nr:ParB/RepB/Spo0J family partition protein [Kribbella solani]
MPAWPRLEITYLPVASIAEHPKNPRKSLPKVDEMAASLQSNGFLQPVVVIPMAAALEALADELAAGGVGIQAGPGLEYVVVIGHRRMAAAERINCVEVPAIIRPDLRSAMQVARTFIVENLQRVDLDPIEEANGLAELAATGLSQREIAQQCGFSQPYVSKRLALLRIPEGAQTAVSKGKVKLADAVKLAALPPEVQEEAFFDWVDTQPWDDVELGEVIEETERKIAAAKQLEANRQQAVDDGVELIGSPEEVFGRNHWDHRLYNDQQIAKARTAGTLRAHATARQVEYYSTIPRESVSTGRSAWASEQEKAKQVKKAAKNREPALQQLAGQPIAAEQMAAEVAAAVVNGNAGHADALKAARRWLPADRFPQPEREHEFGDPVYAWRDAIGQPDQLWVAWVMTIASTEQWLRNPHMPWGQRQAVHVQRLIDTAGYEPTDWETEQLHRIRREATEAAARGDDKAVSA